MTSPNPSTGCVERANNGDDASTTSSVLLEDDEDEFATRSGHMIAKDSGHSSQGLQAPSGNDKDENKPLAKKESQHVSRIRIVVSLLLLTNAVLVLVACYYFLRQQEQKTFETAVSRNDICIEDAQDGN